MMVIDRGLEYRVVFDKSFDFYSILADYIATYKKQVMWKDGIVVIAPMSATDARLVVSQYYIEKKEGWFSDTRPGTAVDLGGATPIELLDEEKEYLLFVIEQFGPAVISHGWYDVTYLKG